MAAADDSEVLVAVLQQRKKNKWIGFKYSPMMRH